MSGAKTFRQIAECDARHKFEVMKSDDDGRLVFGWASVAARATGEVIEDSEEDVIDMASLEAAAYEFTASFGTAGETHTRGGVGRGRENILRSVRYEIS